jgi:hypothetical protein
MIASINGYSAFVQMLLEQSERIHEDCRKQDWIWLRAGAPGGTARHARRSVSTPATMPSSSHGVVMPSYMTTALPCHCHRRAKRLQAATASWQLPQRSAVRARSEVTTKWTDDGVCANRNRCIAAA